MFHNNKMTWLFVVMLLSTLPEIAGAQSFQYKPRLLPAPAVPEMRASGELYVLQTGLIVRGGESDTGGYESGIQHANTALASLQAILKNQTHTLASEAQYQLGTISCNPGLDSCSASDPARPGSSPSSFSYAKIGPISFGFGQNPIEIFHLRPTSEGWPTGEDVLSGRQTTTNAGSISDSTSTAPGSYILWISGGRRYIGPRIE